MRIISRLDIKNEFVIKGINLEGLRKIGDPIEIARQYYLNGIDEIILIDAVASLYGRNNLFEVVKRTTENLFIPITLGGGIKTLKDIDKALNSGADKIAINSAGIENPSFIKEAVDNFGASTITIYIEAKKNNGTWEAYKHYGREKTGINVTDWLEEVQNMECGEILLTSVDHEGTQEGFDLELISEIKNKIKVPLIFSGGFGKIEHLHEALKLTKNISFAIASAFHYKKVDIKEIIYEKNMHY
ncbi:imidazole glycerol phosphate synthase subunit HisF [Candidatus Pelagibacter sp. Uisw_130]|uniref:imidazole glycerol phosphate synthase subunit HisF n=1 Tax=Candidatus Pelagibacter sp. Uisw_130 TaxID=3230989 RepID=UPI0039EB94FC